jgi:hypothetical protein
MRILPSHTRINHVRGSTWSLEIVWQPTFSVTFNNVRVLLDRSMIALPSQTQESRGSSIGIGLTGITAELPLNKTDLVVAESGKTIEFRLYEISMRSSASMPTKEAKTLLFEWLDPTTLPKRIEIIIEINRVLRSTQTLTLVGYNLKESLIEFVAARSDTRFHFPSDEAVIPFEPSVIYEQTPLLQGLKMTTVWGVSGPHEVWFWRTEGGTRYLVEQIRKLKSKGWAYEPLRVSLCPYDSQVDAKTRRAFLAEMEVQHECGVNVRMTDQRSLEDIVGTSDLAIAVFGDAMGLMYHGFRGAIDEGYILVALDQARLHELRERFGDLYNASSEWERYKRNRAVRFSDRATQSIIARRKTILSLSE